MAGKSAGRVDAGVLNRRDLLVGAAAMSAAAPSMLAGTGAMAAAAPIMRTIPTSGVTVPAIGMGSWLTFDVGGDEAARAQRTEVLRAFFAKGGGVIDSSPMYGSSQAVIGDCLARLGRPAALFSADKVWTGGDGAAQIEETRRRWGVDTFDLLQVHNLVDWRRKLDLLFAMKAEGRIRHVGATSYAGLRYDEIAQLIETEPLDFIQITYNVLDREAERRLLPLAHEKGVAVIANRPFREGALFSVFQGRELPAIAGDIGARSGAEFMLKFIISHPAMTAAIPATRRVDHMLQNMSVLSGALPDPDQRRAMIRALNDF